MEMRPEDMIFILTQQRNTAMDEIARQGVIIRALQRELIDLRRPTDSSGELSAG